MASNLSRWDEIISAKAKQYGLDPAIVRAVIWQESRGNPNAVSPVGAQGLMQLMPGTAKDLGVKNSFDPVQNIDAGVRYLKQNIDKYGVLGGLAAYNAGPGNVEKYGGLPPFKETKNYVKNIITNLNDSGFNSSQAPSKQALPSNQTPEASLAMLNSSLRQPSLSGMLTRPQSFMQKVRGDIAPLSNLETSQPQQLKERGWSWDDYIHGVGEGKILPDPQYLIPESFSKPITNGRIEQAFSNLNKSIVDQRKNEIEFLKNKGAPSWLVNSIQLANKPSEYLNNVAQGVVGTTENMLTPENLLMALAVKKVPFLSRPIALAYAPKMAYGTYEQGKQTLENFQSGNTSQGITDLTKTLLSGLMTGAAIKHVGIPSALKEVGGTIKSAYETLPAQLKEQTGAIRLKDSPVPESPQTLDLQIQSLQEGNSKSVLVTPGEAMPRVPEGMKTLQTKVGTWIYNPAQLKPFQIRRGVAKGEYGDLLGYVEPKSPQTTQTVSAVQDGIEAKTAITSPENLLNQAEALKSQFPQAEIKTGGPELTQQVINDRVSGGKERGFVTTVRESPMSPKPLAEGVSGTYDVLSNADTMARAQQIVQANPVQARDLVLNSKSPTAETYATGMELIRKFNAEGDFTQSIQIANHIARRVTDQGQAIQALSMYNKLGPDGILRLAAKTVEDARSNLPPVKAKVLEKTAQTIADKQNIPLERAMNEAAKQLGLPTLDAEFAKKITDKATEIQAMPEGREKAVATAIMLRDIVELVPPSLGRKVATFQTIAQLLNPKTGIRNILGSGAFGLAENIKDVVAAPIDRAVSLVTGERTKSLSGFNQLGEQWRGFKQGLKEGTQEARQGIDLTQVGDKWEINGIQNGLPRGRTFKNGIMGGLERIMNVALRAPDRAFYQAAFNKRVAELKSLSPDGKLTPEMFADARMESLYKTFQDDSAAARVFSGIKKSLNLNKEFGVGDILLKYPKTPGNILSRSMAYSPVGFMKGVMELGKAALNKGFDQKAFVDSTSRALVGTAGFTAVGYGLSQLGLLRNSAPKDPDLRALEKTAGLGQSQLNVSGLTRWILSGFDKQEAGMQKGDTLVTYDWALPLSIPVSMGARAQEKSLDIGAGDTAALAAAGLEGGLETLGEQPLIRTFTQLAQGKSLPKSLTEAAKGIPASFTPTLLKQFYQLTDNTQRDVRDPNPLKMAANMAIAKTPFAGTLPSKVDPYGKPMEVYQGGTNSILNVMFNPSFVSRYQPTPETKMVMDLYKSTNDARIVPIVVEEKFKFNGIPFEMKAKQRNFMQRWVGERTQSYFSKLANSPDFMRVPDQEKVKILTNYLTDVRAAARAGLFLDTMNQLPADQRPAWMAQQVQKNKLSQDQVKNLFRDIAKFQIYSRQQ